MDQEYPKTRFFFEKRKKSSKMQKLENIKGYAKISGTPFDQRSPIHWEAWFPPYILRQNQQKKKNIFLRADFRPLPNKNVQILDHFFQLLFPKDSESLKILDIRLQEVGAKRQLNGTSRSEHTDGHTHRQTHRRTNRLIESIGPGGQCFEN